jgi:DNA topoisomerase VI subunit B
MEQVEKNILIAKRVPPSDRWSLINEDIIYNSLTETLEAYFQKTQTRCDFKLSPLKGELYIITTEEVAPPPPKKFNLYGDY